MKFVIFSLALLGSACSTSSSIKIQSLPEAASVSAKSSDGSLKPLGKTPITLSSNELSSDSRIISLVVSKEGFTDQSILLGRDRSTENYDILVKLQGETEDPKMADSRERQEKLAKSMVQAHNLISSKRYDEAKNLLNTIIQDYPKISVGYDLLGNLSYLQRDLKSALNYYERSLNLNPDNIETRSMVDRLKAMIQ